MELRSPRIYDIARDRSGLGYELFARELERIREKDFKLKTNYEKIQLDQFYAFSVLVDEDRLVAFSGLQKPGPWNAKVARLSSRFYIAPEFQTSGMLAYKLAPGYQSSYHTGSRYLNPYQIRVARELDLSGVFISREYPSKRRSLFEIARRCEYFDPSVKYEVLPDLMNVCPPVRKQERIGINRHASCWQNIIAVKLRDDFEIGLPRLPLAAWKAAQVEA